MKLREKLRSWSNNATKANERLSQVRDFVENLLWLVGIFALAIGAIAVLLRWAGLTWLDVGVWLAAVAALLLAVFLSARIWAKIFFSALSGPSSELGRRMALIINDAKDRATEAALLKDELRSMKIGGESEGRNVADKLQRLEADSIETRTRLEEADAEFRTALRRVEVPTRGHSKRIAKLLDLLASGQPLEPLPLLEMAIEEQIDRLVPLASLHPLEKEVAIASHPAHELLQNLRSDPQVAALAVSVGTLITDRQFNIPAPAAEPFWRGSSSIKLVKGDDRYWNDLSEKTVWLAQKAALSNTIDWLNSALEHTRSKISAVH